MSLCLGFFRGVEMLAAFVPIAQVCETPDGLSLWEKSEAREAGLTCSAFLCLQTLLCLTEGVWILCSIALTSPAVKMLAY